MTNTQCGLLIATLCLVAACRTGGEERGGTPTDETGGLVEEVCDWSCADERAACYDETAYCSTCDPRTCNGICGGADDCLETGYAFHFDEVDSDVGAACRRYADHVGGCTGDDIRYVCETYERTHRHGTTELYDCMAHTECGAEASCGDPSPTGAIDTVCGVFGSECDGRCTDDLVSWVRDQEGWMRPQVLDALEWCASLDDCRDLEECLEDWTRSVYPDASPELVGF